MFLFPVCCGASVFQAARSSIVPSSLGTHQTILANAGQLESATVTTPQWGAADAEIKVPSGESTELKRSPFKAWSRSV